MSRLGAVAAWAAVAAYSSLAWAQVGEDIPHIELATHDIIMVVDHDLISDDQQVYDAYGLALHLANRGVVVDWWIAQDKSYEGIDFTAETDDNPDPDTPEADGAVEVRDYRAGPFVIRDPDPSTPGYNEAWDVIRELQAALGYAPLFHEIRVLTEEPRLNAGLLTFMPRVVYSSHKGIAEEQLLLASIPAFSIEAPGRTSASATAAGGGLFEGDADAVCGRRPAYDVFIQDHYDWDSPDINERAALAEFDAFLRAGTTCIFECDSATVDNTLHWLTEVTNVAVEGDALAGSYTVEGDFADHPFAQTMGEVPEIGGAFSLWDADANRFLSSAQHIFYDEISGDYGYMLGQVEGGKFFFAGGHRRQTLSDQRLILNALLYEVISPQFIHEISPAHVPQGERVRRTVLIYLRGGSLASNALVVEHLADGVEYVPRSAEIFVRGGTVSWDESNRELTLDIGQADPNALWQGLLAQYEVDLTFGSTGEHQLMTSTIQYDDPWTAGITFAGQSCESVEVFPQLVVHKYTDKETLVVGDNEVLLTLEVRNTGNTVLRDVVVTDTLPARVTFLGPIDTFGRGVADFDETNADAFTWEVGWLAPGERAAATFAVVASPNAPGDFLLNDGPAATAVVDGTASLTGDGPDLSVRAVNVTGPYLVFSLNPGQADAGSAVTMDFEVVNFGRDADHTKRNFITLAIPEGWSAPTNIVVPTGWSAFYNTRDRTLTLDHPAINVRFRSGTPVPFSFELIPPSTGSVGLFEARATIGTDPVLEFRGELPVGVVTGNGVDSDGDGLADSDEDALGTDSQEPDSDGDGLPDGYEVGPFPLEPRDSDNDGDIDALDTDSDGDGIDDAEEGPGDPDGDGVPNFRDTDSDGDSLDDDEERSLGTNPLDADSDDDGIADGSEPGWATDTDGDGLIGALDPDSDGDGLMDGTELGVTEPLPDTNVAAGFFIPDGDPTTTTDPLDSDTDGGGAGDGAEDLNHDGVFSPENGETDPTDPTDDPTPTDDGGVDSGGGGSDGGLLDAGSVDAGWDSGTEPVWDAGTEPVWDAGTEPVWDAGTEPVWDSGTEPVWDAGTEPVWDGGTEPVWDASPSEDGSPYDAGASFDAGPGGWDGSLGLDAGGTSDANTGDWDTGLAADGGPPTNGDAGLAADGTPSAVDASAGAPDSSDGSGGQGQLIDGAVATNDAEPDARPDNHDTPHTGCACTVTRPQVLPSWQRLVELLGRLLAL